MDCAVIEKKRFPRACVDSRLVEVGDLFFALPGARCDGQDFVEEVAKKGAMGAVVCSDYDLEIPDFCLFRVDDPLQELQKIAKEALQSCLTQVVAITGSLGKTTTKTFLHTLLGEKFKVASSPGNYNSQIGLPLTILNHTQGDEDLLILEMGMTQKGEIARLVEIAPPKIALINTIDAVHLGYFSSVEEIAQAKGEIFSHPQTELGIFPEDSPYFEFFFGLGNCRKQTFAYDSSLELPVLGQHNLHNFAAAAAVAKALGMSTQEITQRIPFLQLPERRLEQVEKKGILFINDAYNASVTSMKAALNALPQPYPGRKKVAVLGGMVELGEHSEKAHRQVAKHALACVDMLLCLHDSCEPMIEVWEEAGRQATLFRDRPSITQALKQLTQPGDVVLLKGSNVRGLWHVLEEF